MKKIWKMGSVAVALMTGVVAGVAMGAMRTQEAEAAPQTLTGTCCSTCTPTYNSCYSHCPPRDADCKTFCRDDYDWCNATCDSSC